MNAIFVQYKEPIGSPKVHYKPNRVFAWVSWGLFVGGAVLCGLPLLLLATPIRWTISPSLPPGFYWETHKPIVRGVYVHFCLDEEIAAFGAVRGYLRSGTCPGMYEELVKVVAATAGDVVEIGQQGMTINGQPVPNAPIYAADSQGRPHHFWIDAGRYVVPDGEVFVLSTYHPRSWDSRYFGFVPVSAIRGTAQPWWVWP